MGRITKVSAAAGVVAVLLAQLPLLGAAVVVPSTAAAAPLDPLAESSLDGPVRTTDVIGDPQGVAVLEKANGTFNGFPTEGPTALILSTGDASIVADPAAAAGLPTRNSARDLRGADLAGSGEDAGDDAPSSADGQDLTQVKIELAPPEGATCVSFDFVFLSEEYPRYVDEEYNDIFTAEMNETDFALDGNQVSAANNFAYAEGEELLSVNTFTSFVNATDSPLNGRSPVLSATSDIEYVEDLPPAIYLSVQDLGDSEVDSAVVVDNLRYADGATCSEGIVSIRDTDGDGLSDLWETEGIDYDGDGDPELDLPAMGADPDHKDVFVEIDWMYEEPACISTATASACPTNFRDKTPDPAAIAAMVSAFAAAPVSNPDNSPGIALHVDAGPTSPMDGTTTWGDRARGTAVTYAETIGSLDGNGWYDWTAFDDVKDRSFDDVRRDAFHYVLYANYLGDRVDTSGRSRGLPGGDVLLTDGPWAVENAHEVFSTRQEAGTLMHELGHNLGLHHAADRSDDPSFQDGYYSVMNYCYQLPGLQGAARDTGTLAGLDYSRGTAMDVTLPCQRQVDLGLTTTPTTDASADSSTDDSSGTSPTTDAADPTSTTAAASTTTTTTTVAAIEYDDWANLVFDGGSIGDLGAGAAEPTVTTEDELSAAEARSQDVSAAAGDGVVSLIGPDLLAAGVDDQALLVNVHNPSAVETTYRVEVEDPWSDEPVEVTVAPYESELVELPVDASRATEGAEPMTVSLYNGDLALSSSARDVHSIDLGDEAAAEDVQEILDQLTSDPAPEGFHPRATALLQEAMEPVLAGEVTPEIEDDSGFPTWLLAVIAAVVVLLVVIGITVVRRGRKA